jgi:predicted O-linked N-acetylglucosamine transferase (SPINDLY family)
MRGIMTVAQSMTLAIEHQNQGRLAEAEALYRQILDVEPTCGDATANLGVIALRVNRPSHAAELFRRAMAIQANVPEYHHGYGVALTQLNELTAAEAQFRRAVTLQPDFIDAWRHLGHVLRLQHRLEEALRTLEHVMAAHPDDVPAMDEMAMTLNRMQRFADALTCIERAIQIRPDMAVLHKNRGNALLGLDRVNDAADAFEQAIRLCDSDAVFHNNFGYCMLEIGNVPQAIASFRRAVELAPGVASYRLNLLYTMQFDPAVDLQTLAGEQRQFDALYAAPLRRQILPHTNDRDPNRRLRIGYVSPDFRRHPVGFFIRPLLEHHDRSAFEIHCYSNVQKPDELTAACRAAADGWVDIAAMNDQQVAQKIRADGIDILIDLALGGGGRLLVFALKPAPVQVAYLGYPGTTGLGTMDYRLTDAYLHPPGALTSWYSERSVRLAHSYWCYAPEPPAPAVAPLPAASAGHVTFGSLNAFRKISDDALDAWARILKHVPDARLILHAMEGWPREHATEVFKRHEVEADRVEFVGRVARGDYFRTYDRIDIALDAFPYTGGTTTCDALWMGVPVVSLGGDRAVFRGGVSVLWNAGLPELLASSADEYMAIATSLAANLPALSAMREGLRQRLLNSPLMDAPGFASDFEAALRNMWRQWIEAGKDTPASCPR